MEATFEVCWDGLYTYDEVVALIPDPNLVLYSIYSTHPLYGNNVLVYIGMTENGLGKRQKNHSYWTLNESDPVKIDTASIGKFESWAESENVDEYPPLESSVIRSIEELLIIAHQPAYNSRSKGSAENSKNIRIFNTGKFGSLLQKSAGFTMLEIHNRHILIALKTSLIR